MSECEEGREGVVRERRRRREVRKDEKREGKRKLKEGREGEEELERGWKSIMRSVRRWAAYQSREKGHKRRVRRDAPLQEGPEHGLSLWASPGL